ncbi:hypothetical protein SAMN05428941_2378 [Streptomyces sp. 2114.2]|nr:hypothetical protein BX268_2383 [Streptomyces sp. 2221.1]SDT29771.1 hypothetical protein SAMN05428941_2378 [Streptomyces sp. 2114.2]
MNNLAAVPVAAVLLHALAVLEVPGFLELDEGFVIAHPAHLPQDKALMSEHIILCAPGYVDSPAAQYTGGLYAMAYEGYGGSDYCDIERVYEAQPRRGPHGPRRRVREGRRRLVRRAPDNRGRLRRRKRGRRHGRSPYQHHRSVLTWAKPPAPGTHKRSTKAPPLRYPPV